MRRLLPTVSVLVVAGGVGGTVLLCIRWANAPVAALEVSPREVSVGSLLAGEAASFCARLRNNTRNTLSIVRISASCGCADVTVDPKQLAPGESAVLTGTVHGGGSGGAFRHQVLVTTAPPAGGQATFTIVGQLKRRLSFSPEKIVARPDFVKDKAESQVITIRNATSHTVHLRQVSALPHGVSLDWEQVEVAPRSTAELTVTVDACTLIPQVCELRMAPTDAMEPSMALPITIAPLHPATLTPRTFHFGVLSRAELNAVQQLIVEASGDLLASSDIEDVATPGWLRLDGRVGNYAEHATRRFTFRVLVDSARTDLAGQIVFAFRHRPTGFPFSLRADVTGFLLDPIEGETIAP